MTVPEDQTNRVQENGNGVKVDFDFDFRIFDAEEVEVWLVDNSDESQTLQDLGVDYSVAINGVDNDLTTDGGTVTWTVAPATGFSSLLISNYEFDQTSDFSTGSNLPEVKFENGLDKLTLICIQLNEELSRALKVSEASTTTGITIPNPNEGKGLIWDDSGDLVNSVNDLDQIAIDAQQSADDAAASASSASTSESNAATSETNAAASAAEAVAAAQFFSAANIVWSITNDTQLVMQSGGTFKGTQGNMFTFQSNRTFDITLADDQAGALAAGNTLQSSTLYYILGIGDTTGTLEPDVLGVEVANYASFTTSDLPTGYDDYKNLGPFRVDSNTDMQHQTFDRGHGSLLTLLDNNIGQFGVVNDFTIDMSGLFPDVVRRIQIAGQSSNTTDIEYGNSTGGIANVTIIANETGAASFQMWITLVNGEFIVSINAAVNVTFLAFEYIYDFSVEGQ